MIFNYVFFHLWNLNEQSKIDEDSLYERKQEEWDILADKGEEF